MVFMSFYWVFRLVEGVKAEDRGSRIEDQGCMNGQCDGDAAATKIDPQSSIVDPERSLSPLATTPYSVLRTPYFFPFPPWAKGLTVLLSLRPIMRDLYHNNVNIFVLFLLTGSL